MADLITKRAQRSQSLMAMALALIATITIVWAGPASAQVVLRDAEIEEWLDDYSRPMLSVAGINPDTIKIYLIGDPSFNAFAGGSLMGFHTGFLTQSATPNEIEAVIAHEVGHLAGGHTARSDEALASATRPMLLSLVLAAGAVAAGAPEAGIGLLGLGQNIGLANYLRYSRAQEASADQASLTYLKALKKSGKGALDVWRKRRNEQVVRARQINPYRQTHPLAVEREESLRERVEASPYYGASDTEAEIYRLKMLQAKINGFMQETQATMNLYPLSDVSDPARYARAVAYYRASLLIQALQEIDSLIDAYPENPYFHELKGQMLFEHGRVAESVAPHRASVTLAPEQALLRINLGRALLGLEDASVAPEAISELRAALKLEPDNAFAWFELSRAYGLVQNIPMAYLATAEARYHGGSPGEAAQFATRALKDLPVGSPEHRQAQDILRAAQNLAANGKGRRRR